MGKIGINVEQLNELKPLEIVRNDKVRDKFIQIYEAMWTPSTGVSGEAAYEKESRNFNRLLSEKEDIRKKCNHFLCRERTGRCIDRLGKRSFSFSAGCSG